MIPAPNLLTGEPYGPNFPRVAQFLVLPPGSEIADLVVRVTSATATELAGNITAYRYAGFQNGEGPVNVPNTPTFSRALVKQVRKPNGQVIPLL